MAQSLFSADSGQTSTLHVFLRSRTPGALRHAYTAIPPCRRFDHAVVSLHLSYACAVPFFAVTIMRMQAMDREPAQRTGWDLRDRVRGFSVMDNHLHLLLRIDSRKAVGWSGEEVARLVCAVSDA